MTRVFPAIVFLALSALGCEPEEILVANLPVSEAGAPPDLPRRCVDKADCKANELCSKSACGQAAGTCEPRPIICGADGAPTCGCDGITYFNDCLRRAAGVASSAPNECGPKGVPCGPPSLPCPTQTSCARLVPPAAPCAGEVPGTCWALPAECGPPSAGGDRWIACGPPSPCVDTCAAIRSGLPFARALVCP